MRSGKRLGSSMILVLLATLITKLQVPVTYAIFVLDLKILKWDTKPSEGTPAIVLAR